MTLTPIPTPLTVMKPVMKPVPTGTSAAGSAGSAGSTDPAPERRAPVTAVTLTVNRGDAVILRSIADLTQEELDAAATHVRATLGPDIPVLVLSGRRWGIHVIRGGTR